MELELAMSWCCCGSDGNEELEKGTSAVAALRFPGWFVFAEADDDESVSPLSVLLTLLEVGKLNEGLFHDRGLACCACACAWHIREEDLLNAADTSSRRRISLGGMHAGTAEVYVNEDKEMIDDDNEEMVGDDIVSSGVPTCDSASDILA